MFWPPVGSATRSNRHCALPHLIAPQGAQEGRHRHRCALPVPLVPATPLPPREGAPSIASLLHVCGCTAPAGSLRRRRSATEDALLLGGCSATESGAARPATDPLQAFLPLCQASQCTAAGLLRQGAASQRTSRTAPAVWPPARVWAGGQRGGKRAPTPLAGRCAPWLYAWSFTGRAVCYRAPGAGPCSCPLTASHDGGVHGGGRHAHQAKHTQEAPMAL